MLNLVLSFCFLARIFFSRGPVILSPFSHFLFSHYIYILFISSV